MSLFEMKNVKKDFGKLKVLKCINLSVEEGEVIAILGPSGSGKSTFLRCATMLEKMDYGTLTINGISATTNSEGEPTVYISPKDMTKVREQYGLVFQNFNLFPHFTVLQNIIDAPVHVLKQDKAQATENAMKLLEKVGLSDKKDYYPAQLSGGQQQRVAIARALAMNPRLLFFDEPTSALDPEITAGILGLLKELAAEKMTMIIVTHEIDFARKVADRVIFMEGGYIIEEGSPEQVIDNPQNARTREFLQHMKSMDI